MSRKQKPLHQIAKARCLSQNDSREIQKFREFLRAGNTNASYMRVYGNCGFCGSVAEVVNSVAHCRFYCRQPKADPQ